MSDTIFALSSGHPPAAIAVIRISGPSAGLALQSLSGALPPPRVASLRQLRSSDSAVLDEALVLWFPGPHSATGEDCSELHCHGGRAVVAAILAALRAMDGMRDAEPGEFTRRAFENGRMDLAQAEALADLLTAETELQRRVAQAGVGGALSQQVHAWRSEVLTLSAMVEAVLDFSEDDDIEELGDGYWSRKLALRDHIRGALARPRGERLREGLRVVLAGPPNSGKSSLFNALIGEGAAIVSDQAGTTRDVLERPLGFGGIPFVLIDTAGLRERAHAEAIEAIGIDKAAAEIARADIVLWLGGEGEGPDNAIELQAKCDDLASDVKANPNYRVSSQTGQGLTVLIRGLIDMGSAMLPGPTAFSINERQGTLLEQAVDALSEHEQQRDLLLEAEALRTARVAFDHILGSAGVEDMFDALFSRFCIGK